MVIQIYEIVAVAIFLLALGWAIRSRDPFNVGAVLGGFLLFCFDWLWCTRGFFNVTTNPNLTLMPGLHMMGVDYPVTFACLWSIGFGVFPLLASKAYGPISRALGPLHVPVVFVVAGVLDLAIEIPLVSGLGLYTYHQAPQYLLMGVPWSNLWFGGFLLSLPYFGLTYARKWAAIPQGAGLSLSSETTWKGLLLAGATLWSSFFLPTVAQLFWYSAATPWVDSGRIF